MANVIVVGTQWGDEGKGKIVDLLSEYFDAVARYQGGTNAGHTVVVEEEKIVLHLVPSGVLRKGKVCILGNGVVIDLTALIQEIDQLSKLHVKIEENFFISKNAHLVLPYHAILDAELERLREGRQIGTTRRGIGPAYVDKMARTGIRVGDLADRDFFKERLRNNLEEKRVQFPHHQELQELDYEKMAAEQLEQFERVRGFVVDSSLVIHDLIKTGKSVLFEGAQGTLLDVDLGTYPYVTSSSATAGGACTGTGVSPLTIDGVLGVTKAYTTRVGEGPMPTELTDAIGQMLQKRGQELGATTGRPRRCGWFDAVAVRYSARINGLSALALMKLDVLDTCESIRICTSYRCNGTILRDFPNETGLLQACEPIYEEVPGWNESIAGITSYKYLPTRCRTYIERIEGLTGVKVGLISIGPRRDQTILRSTPALRQWGLAR
ncbi:MAG: adenylosuccinate synthase [candidate division NC10 bacterium]|nr:adenylosuccinate synthase [candidate division NC10 bacterium]